MVLMPELDVRKLLFEVLRPDVPTDGRSRNVLAILMVPVFSIAALVSTSVGAKVCNSGVAMRAPVTTTSSKASVPVAAAAAAAAAATPADVVTASSPNTARIIIARCRDPDNLNLINDPSYGLLVVSGMPKKS